MAASATAPQKKKRVFSVSRATGMRGWPLKSGFHATRKRYMSDKIEKTATNIT